MKDHKDIINDEQQAVMDYLDALLGHTELTPEYQEPVAVRQDEPLALANLDRPEPVVAPVITHNIVIPDVKLPAPVEQKTQSTEQLKPVEPRKHIQPERAEIPEWGQTTFKVLLFKVGAIQLAVPLVKLYGMVKKPGKIKSVALTPDWYKGLMQHREHLVQVVDTHALINPNKVKQLSEQADEHIMLICHGEWGLTVDELQEVISLNPSEVNWRGATSKRPWLAGMVPDKMAAIMDVDALESMLVT